MGRDVGSGKMVHYVTLQRRSTTRDAAGEQLDTYTDLGESFCQIMPISGREKLVASGEMSDVTHRIRMRARDDFSLEPRDRAVYVVELIQPEQSDSKSAVVVGLVAHERNTGSNLRARLREASIDVGIGGIRDDDAGCL